MESANSLRTKRLVESLLNGMHQHNRRKYSKIVNKSKRAAIVEEIVSYINLNILALHEAGKIWDLEELKKLRKEIKWTGHGIYIHVIVEKEKFRFYIGQSWDLRSRVIDQHCNSSYRKTNPSLHYLALDKSDFDFFLSFSECRLKDPDRFIRQKKLNVLEMVASLMFRSLPHDTSRLYLPVEEDLGPTMGLNVASPLDQGNKEECIAALALLRNSADPVVHEYYQARILGSKEFRQATADKATARFLQGLWAKISIKPHGKYVTIHHLHLYIPDAPVFDLDPRATHVFLRAELSSAGADHPRRLVKVCEKGDPARRLGVQILAFSRDGQTINFWVQKSGEKVALYANSIVDWLENIPLEDIAKKPRRYIHAKSRRFLTKAEEKRKEKTKSGVNRKIEEEAYQGNVNEGLFSCFPIIAAAEEAVEDTNVGFEAVGSSGVVNVSETVDENSYTSRRLNEAEFEMEKERPRKEKESFANTYNHDTFLALYCSPSSYTVSPSKSFGLKRE